MPNALSQFDFQTNAVRTIAENGEIWFVAKDVLTALDYSESSNPAKVTQNIPEEWKGVKLIHTLGGKQKLLMISEQGLYFFLGRSDKPKALPFQKWLAGEVLPAIRKTGSYSVSISKAQQGELATLITERFPSGKDRPYAWSRFNNHFRLASYKDLPASRFEEACEYIKTMPEQMPALPRPSVNLLDKDYFAKVRDIAIKFADDWVRVGKGEDVHPTLTIPDDVLAGIVAQQLSKHNFRLYVDYAGSLSVEAIPNKSPYEGLAQAIADPGNIGLTDEVIEEIGAACVKALAYRAQQRKSIISRTRGAK